MTLDEAIARLEDENVHEIILEPDQLLEWLTELKTYIELQKELEAIAYHYGFTSQANMLMEEAAEFTVALNKFRWNVKIIVSDRIDEERTSMFSAGSLS